MRLLTKDETKILFAKLQTFLGSNLALLLELDPPHMFVINRSRVFFVSEQVFKAASKIPRKNLLSFGTCLGKFTKSKKFHLQISALEYLAQFAEHRVWLKPQAEGSFLYGNHILKRYIAKMTENAPSKAGVVIMSPTDAALGFGLLNLGTVELRSAQPESIAVFNQSDVGLYIRKEREIFGGGVTTAAGGDDV